MKPIGSRFLRSPLTRLAWIALAAAVFPALAAPPVVSNVRASQRPGTGLVDIYYDVADADGDHVAISVAVSFDAGVTYTDVPRSLSGPGYGPNIAPGQNLQFVWDAGADLDPIFFRNVRVKITADDGPARVAPEMVLIPAGSFTMGDNYAEGSADERPTHGVYISAFYMDKFEVTKALWDEVYRWGGAHGYTFDAPGQGNGPDHPVHSVSWYDAVKWCNARSEMRGLTPVYYTNVGHSPGQVYKAGALNLSAEFAKWSANGYRLPTEAEWEKAARGGLNGDHFPWPSHGGGYQLHVDGGKANFSGSGDPYENASPSTTPVGYYNGRQTPAGADMANGYGLHDMAGNGPGMVLGLVSR